MSKEITDKKSAYIHIGTGKRFYPYDPVRTVLTIEDIAPGMLNVARFSGQLRQNQDTGKNYFYSLLNHSLVVSLLCSGQGPEMEMAGLLHDSEEVLGFPDVPAPVKVFQQQYKADAEAVQMAIAYQFGYTKKHLMAVKPMDFMALCLEERAFMDYNVEDPDFQCVREQCNLFQEMADQHPDICNKIVDIVNTDVRIAGNDDRMLEMFMDHYYDVAFRMDFKKTGTL
jgi:hypothetical protein